MPGEFVVTFPSAYHGGFNTGLNCAEAVNFAPPDWLRFGSQSVQRFQSFRKQPVISHSWLLLKVGIFLPQYLNLSRDRGYVRGLLLLLCDKLCVMIYSSFAFTCFAITEMA